MSSPSPNDSFDRWYKAPLQHLESLPNGDGAFVALAVSCFLYERYCVAYLKSKKAKANDAAKRAQLEADFSVDTDTANAFWDVIRNGFLHQGMGLQKTNKSDPLPTWSVSQSFPRLQLDKGPPPKLKIQPWLFRDRVIELWDARPDLIDANTSFPWATIYGPT
ncbi:MAG: hypothetical protein H8E66_21325 [Planctomycetes bacterium]|nr:hypothetical protein [Planctomycetota bacterium]